MKYVTYLRASTRKQEQSGLGIEAQRSAVQRFASGEILAEYVEIESGRKVNRPRLAEALAYAKRNREYAANRSS